MVKVPKQAGVLHLHQVGFAGLLGLQEDEEGRRSTFKSKRILFLCILFFFRIV